jgi:dipeptidyl-peptidase-4
MLMKRFSLILLLSCCFVSLSWSQGTQSLDLKDVVTGKFRPTTVRDLLPMNDDEFYTQMNEEGTQVIKYSFRTGKQVEVLFDVATARNCPFKSFDSYSFSPDGLTLLIATDSHYIYRRSFTANYYLYTLSRNADGVTTHNKVEKLSDGGPLQSPVFSPDGTMIAFVRQNNIFLVKRLYNNSESQVTTDGKRNEIINGLADWVYEEEFSMTQALAFSADSKMIAFIRFDESKVPSYSFPLYAGSHPRIDAFAEYPGTYVYKYPKTGCVNSTVSVRTFDIQSKVTRTLKLPLDADGYIPRIAFTQDPTKLAVATMNRTQNRFDIYMADPRSTVCKLVMRDENKYYINEEEYTDLKFVGDNFALISERDGHKHLYWYTLNGTLVKKVTSGDMEVSQLLGYNAKTKTFYYISNEGNPLCSYVCKSDEKGRQVRLSKEDGTNSATCSKNAMYYLDVFSNVTTPPVVTLNDGNGKMLATIETNEKLRQTMSEYAIPQKEFFNFTIADGSKLNGWMMKPANFDASHRYPVLLYQYSGPGSQEVRNAFAITWETYMASHGYVVVCVDGRGTGGRGEEFEKCTYMNIGVKEAQDQVATAQYMAQQPYVDKNRIGIWGWSYGGYMTLMSMSEGTPVFKAGVAVAPVTDWHYYDTIYGERFMRTPKENADGYKSSSAIERADKLNGNLLILHGLADDNVHYQNTAEYMEQLVQLGKMFYAIPYNNRNHSIFGGNTRYHLYSTITHFFDTNL